MSSEQDEILSAAERFTQSLPLASDESGTWQSLIDMGWLLVNISVAQGGIGLGVSHFVALQRLLGQRLSSIPFLPVGLALEALSNSGKHPEISERVLSGGRIITTSLADFSIGIEAHNDEVVVSGGVEMVQSADRADEVVLWDESSSRVILVPLQHQGVEVVHTPTWDVTRKFFRVDLCGAVFGSENIVESGTEARALISRILAVRDLGIAADSIGGANEMLAQTVGYLESRRQFGRPLSMFQALKHRCADVCTNISAAEALQEAVLAEFESLDPIDSMVKSLGLLYLATMSYENATEEGLQLHGGIAMASEHPCHLFVKRARLNARLGRSGYSYRQLIANYFVNDHREDYGASCCGNELNPDEESLLMHLPRG